MNSTAQNMLKPHQNLLIKSKNQNYLKGTRNLNAQSVKPARNRNLSSGLGISKSISKLGVHTFEPQGKLSIQNRVASLPEIAFHTNQYISAPNSKQQYYRAPEQAVLSNFRIR